MRKIKNLYGAYIKFPQAVGDIEFNYSAIEVVKVYPDMIMIETKHSYFTDRNHSTKYFDNNILDKELEITDELTVFYSKDKEKCIAWLNKRRFELLKSYKNIYERLEKSEIKEVFW